MAPSDHPRSTTARPIGPCGVRALRLAAVALVTLSLATMGGCHTGGRQATTRPAVERARPLPLPEQTRAVWVARFHYRYPDDIRTIMRNAAADGLNTVLWQVRGNGTVAYPSKLEPWSKEYDHHDPGYDPLQIAIAEAHRRGLRIEAWVNVMPGWRGPEPPPIRNQLWYTHPEWFLRDADGQRQPLGKFYVILNPCLPEVRRHITDVIGEIAANYDVDGIHLDYIRYAWDTTPHARQRFPRDPRTLALYHAATGKRPDDDVASWDRWRAAQLTQLVADIRRRIAQVRPAATLTAATWPSPKRGFNSYFQDAGGWLRAGLLDAAIPMMYTPKLATFEAEMAEYRAVAPQARIIPGLGIYKHKTPEQMRLQLQRCMDWGGEFALFSYESLHATASDRGGKTASKPVSPRVQALRRMRVGVLRAFTNPR